MGTQHRLLHPRNRLRAWAPPASPLEKASEGYGTGGYPHFHYRFPSPARTSESVCAHGQKSGSVSVDCGDAAQQHTIPLRLHIASLEQHSTAQHSTKARGRAPRNTGVTRSRDSGPLQKKSPKYQNSLPCLNIAHLFRRKPRLK